MTKKMTYGQLQELLTSLGFHHAEVKGSHQTYFYEDRPEMIFPIVPKNRQVMPAHLAVVRFRLADLGIADPDEFADMMHGKNGAQPR
jgi:predicted RNA binding protein YcfA (HicA-like mRNA interferase family)